jgi:glycosyltransferase involved in cell wall biosynthesis
MKSATTLLILTQKFPFESGEEFLVPELKRLADEFDRIILVPTAVRDYSQQRQTPKNVLIHPVQNPETTSQIFFSLFKRLPEFVQILWQQLKYSRLNMSLLKYWFYHIPFAIQIRDELESFLKNEEPLVFYSYWVDTNAFALSLLKTKYPRVKFVVRTHGGDLYDERSPTGQIAFRKSIYESAAAIWPISTHGQAYIGRNFPDYQKKVKLARLGVEDFGIGPLATEDPSFHIVSCSSIMPVKRIELIAKVILKSEFPIRWIHFGGEKYQFDEILKIIGKGRPGLEVMWMGKVSNEVLMDFYSTQFVDTLINLSASEGIPVSMMEAISFGIPVFANKVGGIGELVVEDSGCLIEEGQTLPALANHLDRWLDSGKTREVEFRRGVRRFWEMNFKAEINHSGFFEKLSASPVEARL